MYCIAVVEDDRKENDRIVKILTDYASKNNLDFKIKTFYDGMTILDHYNPIYDIIFMDILMPGLDGYSACKKIRSVDKKTKLVFFNCFHRLITYCLSYNKKLHYGKNLNAAFLKGIII